MGKSNMIKRADGSYSKHGLWDSIRENKGSGKAPTKEMLKQEKKIKAKYEDGGTTGKKIRRLPINMQPVVNKQDATRMNAPQIRQRNTANYVNLNNTNFNPNKMYAKGNVEEATLDAMMLMDLPFALGKLAVKGLTKAGVEGIKDIYKLNPYAFKPNPEAYYRGVGKEGMSDIFNSKIIKSKKVNAYPEPYFSKGKIGDKYANGYFLELTNEPMKGVGSFNTGDLIQTPVNQVTIDNPNLKLYKQNWLQGYKEMKKFKEGGTIHIKPENRGKFNATKKATGKTTEELTHSKNPVTKKRAIFSQNAAKWKHAEGGEIDPKNSFGLTGNYSRNPNSEAIESNYKLAADYQRRLGNFNAGLNANLGFNQTMPLNTEGPVMSPMIRPDANVGLNVGYDRNNSNLNGSFNYNPVNQGINAEVTYRKRFGIGGLVEYGPGGKTNSTNNRTPIKVTDPNDPNLKAYNDSTALYNYSNKLMRKAFFAPNYSFPENPKLYEDYKIPYNPKGTTITNGTVYKIGITPGVNGWVGTNYKKEVEKSLKTKNKPLGWTNDDISIPVYKKPVQPYVLEKPSNVVAPTVQPVAQPAIVKPTYTSPKQLYQGREFMDSTQLRPGFYHPEQITERMKDPNRKLAYGGRVLPKYADAGWLDKNKAGVGAGLGFAGDTTNLLFDNNVFGTRNKVTDSEGNELGEAQSDAGSQTQGALSGALKGASAGAALGPWGMAGGALIGGVAGFLTADTGAEDKLNQIKRERDAQISFKNILGKGPIGNNAIQTNSQSFYAGGGEIINPNLANNDLNFQKWYKENTLEGKQGIPFNLNNLDYDYYSFYKNGGGGNTTQHFPDTYKLPNHETFSNESLYSGNGAKGKWVNNKFVKFANGGMKTLNQDHPEATEEVELGESAMLPNGMNLVFGGETHENGGLETNLPEGTRIFSDRVKSGKRTIASIAKPIQNKIEKLKENNSKAALNTVKLFENQLDNLFNEQEEIKQIEDMKQQRKYFAKGGLVKYEPGGKKTYRYQPPGAKEMENESDLSELNNIYVEGDANTKVGKDLNDYSDEQLFGQKVYPDSPGLSMDGYTGTYGNTRPIDSNEPRFNKGDIGTAGALGTSLIGNLIQRSNLNKVAPPRTLIAPTFTAGRTPINADYSADLQAADNQFNAARRGVMLNSGNYSTQAGNLGQLRAEQLRNRSKILQNQNNANVALMNEYQKEQADAANKNAASNYATDQANMENLYNYNLWKTGQTNAADASAFNTSGQMFNNMVTGQNQLDAAEMYKRMYAQKVQDDLLFKKAMGGYIPSKSEGDENWVLESRAPRNYFAKGGTVYSQKLQNVLKEDTNTKAAAMDAEYASYLNKEGQPTQNTFKSKITGLDYKVLPRSEKDLYAANLWKETHNTAPTKKQVEATTKALDGKKTSSPGAKAVAEVNNSQVPQIEATLPEVTIYGKRSLNPQQMMDNKFSKPQVTNQTITPVKTNIQTWNKQQDVPTKPVPDWVNKANANKPNFNQVDVNEPVNEKPVVNKPKLKTETPNWLKNPLQPKFDRSEVGEPDNTGSSFNPDANESKIEKGRKYVNNTLKPAIKESIENLSKKIEKNWKERSEAPNPSEAARLLLSGNDEIYKQVIPTSIRNLAKDVINNNLGTNMKITEDALTATEKIKLIELANKKRQLSKNKNYSSAINSYNDYDDGELNGIFSQWSDSKNIRNGLGKFNPIQDGDTLRIKEKYNFNEKDNKQVVETYGESFSKWKEKGYSSAMAMVRALGTRFGSPGSEKGNDNLYGTDVDIKLYNPKKRSLKSKK